MPRFPGADGRASSSIGQAKRYVFFAFPLSVALGSISCTSNNPALEADLSLGPIRHNTLDQRIDQAAADGGEPGRNVQLSDTGPEIQFDARRAVPEVGVLRDAGLPVDAGAPLGDLAADMPASDMEPAVVEDAQTPDQRIDRDDDGDGYSQQQGDCDDSDASIHPEAEDLPYDGIDQDCADGDLVDVDGDGQASEQVRGGTDCDDTDASIFPGAVDVPFDQVDQDCDGRDELTEGATIVAEQSANNAEVAASTSGQLLLVWNHYDITAGTRSVTARRMTASAVALGPPIVVGPAASGVTSVSAVASNGRSYLVVYARGDSRETILLARSISTNGSLGAEQVVARSERQISDVRLVYRAQHYGVAWTTLNQEQTLRQVWLRRLNAAGTGVGAAINVGIAPAPAWRLYGTTLAADDNGGFLVAWNAGPADGSNDGTDIFVRTVDPSGTPADNTTNLTAAPGIQELPGAAFGTTSFLVAWRDHTSNGFEIWGRRVGTDGRLQGSRFVIANARGTAVRVRERPSVTYCKQRFEVVFRDSRNGSPAIFTQTVSTAGALVPSGSAGRNRPVYGSGETLATNPRAACQQQSTLLVAFDESGRGSRVILTRQAL